MSKKQIIMIAGAGLVSFAVALSLAWLTKSAPQSQSSQMSEPTLADQETELKPPQAEAGTTGTIAASSSEMKKAMTEKQLKSLVYEVREKMQEYNSKLQDLGAREQRLQIAQDMLKKDIDELNSLRTELASMVAGLKSERDKLLKSRVEIAQPKRST